jgi:hypothetical protein
MLPQQTVYFSKFKLLSVKIGEKLFKKLGPDTLKTYTVLLWNFNQTIPLDVFVEVLITIKQCNNNINCHKMEKFLENWESTVSLFSYNKGRGVRGGGRWH